MTIKVATNGVDVNIRLAENHQITTTLAWELNAAALSLLSESEISPIDAPSIGLVLDETFRKGYVETVISSFREVESAIIMVTDYEQEDPDETTYFLYVSRGSNGTWKIANSVVVSTRVEDEPGFRSLILKDQLGFFSS